MSPTGVFEREAFGVARWIFALRNQMARREEGINLLQKQENSIQSNLPRLPVQVRNLRASSLVDECAAGLCRDSPGEGLRGLKFSRQGGSLRLGIHRRETPGRREQQRDCDVWKARWRIEIDDGLADSGRSSTEKPGTRRVAGSFGDGDDSLALWGCHG